MRGNTHVEDPAVFTTVTPFTRVLEWRTAASKITFEPRNILDRANVAQLQSQEFFRRISVGLDRRMVHDQEMLRLFIIYPHRRGMILEQQIETNTFRRLRSMIVWM
jgi:hypothetical protein